jgi:C-terminal processing protease CtpA/Prc
MSKRNLVGVAVALCAVCVAIPSGALAGDATRDRSVHVSVTSDSETDDPTVLTVEVSEDDSAWLGVGVNDLSKSERSELGVPKPYVVHVNEVYDGSPAEEAGIEVGDVIISIDDKEARDTNRLIEIVQTTEPLTEVDVLLYRDGSEIKKRAVLGVRPHKYVWTSDELGDISIDLEGLEGLAALGELGDLFVPRFDVGYAWGGKGRLGVYVDDLSEGLAEYFEVPGGKGVLVEDIVEGGPAEKAGIHAGDIIIEIAGTPVAGTGELTKAISRMEGEVPTEVVIVRGGKRVPVEVTVDKAAEHIVRVPGSGVYIFGDDESKALAEYQTQAKEALEEQLQELQKALAEMKAELEELREDSK